MHRSLSHVLEMWNYSSQNKEPFAEDSNATQTKLYSKVAKGQTWLTFPLSTLFFWNV